jgi:phosphoglycolate phosphatase-like HAD superfamily hydrolase
VIKPILFDIDGTLVLTGRAGARAMGLAFDELFGIRNGFDGIPMAGRTDAWIISETARRHGVPTDAGTLRKVHEVYVQHLQREILEDGPRKGVLPGVRELLDALSGRDGVFLALLTGNFQTGAHIKLEHFDLWRYFPCGAFGDDAPERNVLLMRALTEIEACSGKAVHASDAVIIGDTPLDVAVAMAGGARSIAVATGSHDAASLRASGADVVLDDLSDLGQVLEALELQ